MKRYLDIVLKISRSMEIIAGLALSFIVFLTTADVVLRALGRPYPIDQYAYAGKPAMVRELQLDYATYDCLIACIFGAFAITLQDYADAIAAITGWPFTQEELRLIAERAWNLTRLFNAREGFTRKDDTLPERIFTEASTRGPSNNQVMEKASFERMLDEYYQIVGWDKCTGIPTDKKLQELGLEKLK